MPFRYPQFREDSLTGPNEDESSTVRHLCEPTLTPYGSTLI